MATTIKKPNQYFDATLYTGTGSTQSITNAGGFQPDLVWTKSRSNAYNNALTDSVRGVAKGLFSDLTNAEDTASPTSYVQAFNSNGFSVNIGTNSNANGATYVGWQWKAGGASTVNTSGSISSNVSVNTTAGFSIVSYTGNGTSGATIGHGLGVSPAMIIVKNRSSSSYWSVAHKGLTAGNNLLVNGTFGQFTASAAEGGGISTYSSTTFTVVSGSVNQVNVNTNTNALVAYCWAEIEGYSKFGSYTGNGSTDGPFIYLGFRPKFLMVKVTSTTEDWYIWDSNRGTYNANTPIIYADLSDAEGTAATDFLSNGFKPRTAQTLQNASGATYIYAAFAESPFKYSNAR